MLKHVIDSVQIQRANDMAGDYLRDTVAFSPRQTTRDRPICIKMVVDPSGALLGVGSQTLNDLDELLLARATQRIL